MAHQQNNNNESVYDWMRSNRIYEEYLFKYVIILVFIGAIGFFTFGFELQGQSLQYSLLANFIYFIVLVVAMALMPLWYKLLFNRGSQRQKHIEEIKKNLEKIEDVEQRQAIQQHLANNGELPPRKAQRWALIFLGWCFLFEMFFVSSWVKDMALVWQPDWVNNIIDWIRGNTSKVGIDPPGFNKPFMVYLSGTSAGTELLMTIYTSEEEFLNSEFGKACLLFHAWRVLSFLPILIAYIISFWQMIGWTGANDMNDKKSRGVWGFIYSFVLTLGILLLGLVATGVLVTDVGYFATSVKGVVGWFNDLWFVMMCYFFIIVALIMCAGWFFFFKNLMLKVYRKFV